MKDSTFYDVLDRIDETGEQIKKIMAVYPGSFPTAPELEAVLENSTAEELFPIIAYLASDPLADSPCADLDEYRKTVSFCKNRLLEIDLV